MLEPTELALDRDAAAVEALEPVGAPRDAREHAAIRSEVAAVWERVMVAGGDPAPV
jgi:hypothetical protein